MFELVATVCVAGPCHGQLLPGYEAETLSECQSLAAERHGGTVATCQPAGPALDLTEIAPGVYVHIGEIAEPNPENGGDVANLGVVVGRDSVAVIDAGSTRQVGESLWRAVRQVTNLPVEHLILTHMHPDHVRQGIGSQLLTAIEPALSQTESFCIPRDHLFSFYGRSGFRVIDQNEAPSFLSERLASYIDEGLPVAIMYRSRGEAH